MPQNPQAVLDQALGTYSKTAASMVPTVAQANLASDAISQALANPTATIAPPTQQLPDFHAMVANRAAGRPAQSELENDLNTMRTPDFRAKYGDAADNILQQVTNAQGQYTSMQQQSRSLPEMAGDNLAGVLGLVGSSALGIAGAGVGLVAPESGATIADKANQFNSWVQQQQSDPLAAHRTMAEWRSIYDAQSDANAHAADLASGENSTIASIANFGRQVIHSIKNAASDPMLLEQGTADNAGAILINYGLTGGLGALADAIAPTVAGAGALTEAETTAAELSGTYGDALSQSARLAGKDPRFLSLADKVNLHLSQGIQMGGMAYQSAVGEVMQKPFDDLQQTSQVYRDAIAEGLSPEDARTYTAGRAGRTAALIAGPLSASVAGISHLSEHPFQLGDVAADSIEAPSVRQQLTGSAKDVFLKQPLEGGLINAGQTLAGNIATQQDVDPSQPIDANLGKAAGEGALYGLTAAASMQGVSAIPHLALGLGSGVLDGLVKAGSSALKLTKGAADEAVDTINAAETSKLVDFSKTVVANAPAVSQEIEADLQKPETIQATKDEDIKSVRAGVQQYTDDFAKALTIDPSEVTNPDLPEHIKAPLEAAGTNRLQAIDNLALDIKDETDPAKKSQLISVLHAMTLPLEPFTQVDPKIMDQVVPDSDTHKVLLRYQKLAQDAVGNMASVREANESAKKFYNDRDPNTIEPLKASEIGTPVGHEKIDDVIANAHTAPESGNLKAIDQVLAHADDEGVKITPEQRSSLLGSKAIIEARQLFASATENSSKVSDQILSETDPKKMRAGTYSAAQYFNEIYKRVRSGDLDGAKTKLAEMGLFVQHLKNKTDAFNTHIEGGNPDAPGVPYRALAPASDADADTPDGVRHWYQSTGHVEGGDPHARINTPGGVGLVRDVTRDQTSLAHAYNGLTDAFPQLGESKIAPSPLHPAVDGGDAVTIAKGFDNGTRKLSDGYSDQFKVQQKATKAQQADFDKVAPKDSIVAKNMAEANKPAAAEPITKATATPVEADATEKGTTAPKTASEVPAAIETAKAETPVVEPTEKEIPAETVAKDVAPVSNMPGFAESTETSSEPDLSDEKKPVMQRYYPDLVQVVPEKGNQPANYFHSSLGLKKGDTPPTRTLDSPSPAESAREILTSDTSLRKATLDGKAPTRYLSSELVEAYKQLLSAPPVNERITLHDAFKVSAKSEEDTGTITNDQIHKFMNLGGLLTAMHQNLQEALNKKTSKAPDAPTIGELLASGKTTTKKTGEESATVNRWKQYKVLNLVEPRDGTFGYNQNLMENAAMAGLHWFLTVGHAHPEVSDDDMEKLTGMPVDSIPDEWRKILNGSYSVKDIKGGITNAIHQFWGTVPLGEADIAYSHGIPEAMAGEVMRGLIDLNLLKSTTNKIQNGFKEDGSPNIRAYTRIVSPDALPPVFEALRAYPSALADAVVVKPEQVMHFGNDDVLKAPDRQMNSDNLNTPDQKTMIDNANAIPHRLNMPYVNLGFAIGRAAHQDMFGGGSDLGTLSKDGKSWINGAPTNIGDGQTRSGKNLTVNGALNHIVDVVNQLDNRSQATKEPIGSIDIHYENNVAINGRLHMLGGQTPQGNKGLREMIMPTVSSLDLVNNGGHKLAYDLAVAQAVGVKVSTKLPDAIRTDLEIALNGKLAPVLSKLREFIRDNAGLLQNTPGLDIEQTTKLGDELVPLWKAAGIDEGQVALHALLDRAMYEESTDEEKSKYNTNLYLELDGKTNGISNAMGMLGNGDFTQNWIDNIKKCGYVVGSDPKSLGEVIAKDGKAGVDLYQTIANDADWRVRQRQTVLSQNEDSKLVPVGKSVLNLMSQFLPGVKANPGGRYTLDRGVTKNPAMITLYGSGAKGIAGNISGELMGSIYARLTDMAREGKGSESLFPNDPNHAAKYTGMINDLNNVFGSSIHQTLPFDFKFFHTTEANHTPLKKIDPLSFKATSDNMETLTQNMLHVLVNPMRESIKATVGPDVMTAAKLIQNATNIQSIIRSEFVKNEMSKALADREANDPTYKPGDFLSQNKLDEINKSAEVLAPTLNVNDGEQSIPVGKSGTLEAESLESTALDGKLATSPDVRIPIAAGVGGMPASILGHGDAAAIQELMTGPTKGEGTQQVFDGLNIPLDRVDEYGKTANEAAQNAWFNNPVRSARDAFFKMLGNSDLVHQVFADQETEARQLVATDSKYADDPEAASEKKMTLSNALSQFVTPSDELGAEKLGLTNPHDVLMYKLHSIAEQLNFLTAQVDARHDVMKEVGLSTDNMASGGVAFHNGVESDIDTSSSEKTAKALNDVLNSKTLKDQPEIPEIKHYAEFDNKGNTGNFLADYLNTTTDPNPDDASDTSYVTDNAQPESVTTSFAPPTVPTGSDRDVMRELTQKVGRADKVDGVETGVRVLSHTAIRNLLRLMDRSDNQRAALSQVFRVDRAKEYTAVTGTREQIADYAKRNSSADYSDLLGRDGNLHGFISPTDRRIYLIDPSAETLTHELIHAATSEVVNAHYSNPDFSDPATKDAITRLELLKNQFMNWEPKFPTSELTNAITNARGSINDAEFDPNKTSSQQKAASMNEFMAWTLSNKALADKLKAKPGDIFIQIAKGVLQSIKDLVWGKQRSNKVDGNMFSNILFNAGILMRDPPSASNMFGESTLAHSEQGASDDLTSVRDFVRRVVAEPLERLPEVTVQQKMDKLDYTEAFKNASITDDAAKRVASVFNMDINQTTAFAMLTGALSTHELIEPEFFTRAQRVFDQVRDKMQVDDFLDPTNSDQQSAESDAIAKMKVIRGTDDNAYTQRGDRPSNTLSSFIALSMVNPEFKSILEKFDTPAIAKSDAKSAVDRYAYDLANQSLDKMSSFISGDLRAKNAYQAMEMLASQLYDHASTEQSFISVGMSKLGGAEDAINDGMVSVLGHMADTLQNVGDKMEASNNKFAKNSSLLVKLLSGALSNKNADLAGESILHTINILPDAPVLNILKKTMGDLVGRTNANALIFDMIKQVRSMVAQVRQNYREQVPRILGGKFSKPLTEEQDTHAYYGLGKADLAALMTKMTAKEALGMFDPSTRKDKIAELEDQIRREDPTNWDIYKKKMGQLADYNMTGKTSWNLLTNATAISKLLGEGAHGLDPKQPQGGPKPKLNGATVEAIDHLTSLYSLDRMSSDRVKALSSLVQSEPKGMEFLLNYMNGQRKGEMLKVGDDSRLLNSHFKGYMPSDPEQGTQLSVMPTADRGALRLMGQQPVQKYTGSFLDGNKESKDYYFSPFNGKTAFAQGTIQNADHTASGVDSTTGYSQMQTAGRITDRTEVQRISQRIESLNKFVNSGSNRPLPDEVEHLLPRFNGSDKVYAYERMLDPKMLGMRNPSTSILDMAGVWRGRQVEEQIARQMNKELVDRAYKMYLDETDSSRPGGSRESEYINAMDPKQTDKIQQEGVRLFNLDTQRYIASKFGSGRFMVRKDLIDDVIGFRQASVGDAWTGNSKWSPAVQSAVRDTMVSLLGPDAYRSLVSKEQMVQGFMADMRRNIAVKSLFIPVMRAVDNVYQLAARGVPALSIAKGAASKLSEIHTYNQARQREVEIEAELQSATHDPVREANLNSEMQTIKDSYKRMSIYPLLKNGEFTTIAGIGDTAEDLKLSSGKISEWLENKINLLPASMQTAARYGIVSRDTALFHGLEQLAEYSDFIAKGILYDHMTKVKGASKEDALARISEEYVNFDRTAGRSRAYTDNMGLTWFLNYKIRIAKVALNMMRNNPFHALVAAAAPAFRQTGNVFEDNVFSKIMDGNIKYSFGPEMAPKGLTIGPIYNLFR